MGKWVSSQDIGVSLFQMLIIISLVLDLVCCKLKQDGMRLCFY